MRPLLVLPLLAAALAVIVPAQAQDQPPMRAHMEGCLAWGGPGKVVVRNDCPRPIAMTFMNLGNSQVSKTELAPGALYTTDMEWNTVGFMFTACPVGLKPSVPFAVENKETIAASLYNCVSGGPTS